LWKFWGGQHDDSEEEKYDTCADACGFDGCLGGVLERGARGYGLTV
jgi:hypothetical protein